MHQKKMPSSEYEKLPSRFNPTEFNPRELLTNYGDIGGIWFDGWWDKKTADWRLDRTYSLIHQLQPRTLIGNNHHRKPFPGEDFQMFEKDLPGGNTTGFNAERWKERLRPRDCKRSSLDPPGRVVGPYRHSGST